jgi:hypothetical protein
LIYFAVLGGAPANSATIAIISGFFFFFFFGPYSPRLLAIGHDPVIVVSNF